MISRGSTIKTEKYDCNIHGPFTGIPFSSIYRGEERTIRPPCPECKKQFNKETKIHNYNLTEQKFRKNVLDANIPLKFCRYNFRDYDVSVSETANHVLNVVQTYYNKFYSMKKFGTSLTLLGFPGTGKTHLSCTLLNRLLFEEKNVYYTTSEDLVNHIKESKRYNSKEKTSSILYKYGKYDLLVIDEIGAYENSQKDLSILFNVIDRRYLDNMPVILVSNLIEKEFIKDIGIRTFDRLKDNNGVVLAFDWESYRK